MQGGSQRSKCALRGDLAAVIAGGSRGRVAEEIE
jgi:hypothetical protein